MGLTFLYGSVSPPVALGAVRLPDERFANHWALGAAAMPIASSLMKNESSPNARWRAPPNWRHRLRLLSNTPCS